MISTITEAKKRVEDYRKKNPEATVDMVWADLLSVGVKPTIRVRVFQYLSELTFTTVGKQATEPLTLSSIGVAEPMKSWNEYPSEVIEGFTVHTIPIIGEAKKKIGVFAEHMREALRLRKELEVATERLQVSKKDFWNTMESQHGFVNREAMLNNMIEESNKVPTAVYVAGSSVKMSAAASAAIKARILTEQASQLLGDPEVVGSGVTFEVEDGSVFMSVNPAQVTPDQVKKGNDILQKFFNNMTIEERTVIMKDIALARKVRSLAVLSSFTKKKLTGLVMLFKEHGINIQDALGEAFNEL